MKINKKNLKIIHPNTHLHLPLFLITGDYPLLLAFLNFMKETCQTKESLPGILLICREILPGLSNWRYQNPGDREHILKLSLATLLAFINNVKEGNKTLIYYSSFLMLN